MTAVKNVEAFVEVFFSEGYLETSATVVCPNCNVQSRLPILPTSPYTSRVWMEMPSESPYAVCTQLFQCSKLPESKEKGCGTFMVVRLRLGKFYQHDKVADDFGDGN